MNHRNCFGPLVLLLACLTFGCQSVPVDRFDPQTSVIPGAEAGSAGEFQDIESRDELDPAWLRPATDPYRLGPGDRIAIELADEAGSFDTTFVCPDGKVYFHLADGVEVWGLTTAEAEQKVAEALQRFVRHPKVVITLEQVRSQRVWILGRLAAPGIYPLTRPTTILEAIGRAGGLFTSRFTGTTEELADLRHSFILREGKTLPVDFNELIRGGDTSQNIYLKADDYIYIPSALSQEVYIMGAVTQSRAVGFKDELTLIQAVAQAKGTLVGAHTREVVIVRGSLSDPKVGLVDLQGIMEGRIPNVRLQPRDIIYVPKSPSRHIHKYARLAVETFASTIAANEGSIAAGGGRVPLNLNVGGQP